MSFDVNDASNLLALKNEVNLDPLGVGYAAVIDTTHLLLEKLNSPANNPGAEEGSAPMTAEALLNVLFDETVSSQDQFKIDLMFSAANSLSEDLSKFRIKSRGLSPAIATAIDNITRPLSRAEALFAVDDANGVKEFVTIANTDWAAARDS